MLDAAHYYAKLHDIVCGRFPDENAFHEQFLSSVLHRKALATVLEKLDGKSVLDIGCGEQPYRRFLRSSCKYVGVDVHALHPETIIARAGSPWPVDGPFDLVICTQVLEHVVDAQTFCGEIGRVLVPGGTLLLSVPFLYPIHDVDDYRRLSPAGMAQFFPGWQLEEVKRLGGLGSTMVLLWNTWIENTLCRTSARRALKGLLFPIRLLLNPLLNAGALLFDLLDGTGRYFHNSLVELRKPAVNT
jgi:SAM-dependent methyltransferase